MTFRCWETSKILQVAYHHRTTCDGRRQPRVAAGGRMQHMNRRNKCTLPRSIGLLLSIDHICPADRRPLGRRIWRVEGLGTWQAGGLDPNGRGSACIKFALLIFLSYTYLLGLLIFACPTPSLVYIAISYLHHSYHAFVLLSFWLACFLVHVGLLSHTITDRINIRRTRCGFVTYITNIQTLRESVARYEVV